MTRILPALYEGHAPIHLHEAFSSALDAYEEWGLGVDEPTVRFEDRDVPISSVFGRMRTCFDILPSRLMDAVAELTGERGSHLERQDQPTFADAALVLRAMCVERLRDEAA
ncbi:hypothetical protein [Aquamicrobium sp. LC103]|uniref:hypothetical protein n=1 Tax=Aquamicrobium sp. LC103 TaxID=1120658 RepID=UPI00063E769A|nr:hypothetical protein [Aquamicrobium sp. LC103]TKT75243.1 hypothetical protein XW59_019085 [Aquamicrobium sp. LC103]